MKQTRKLYSSEFKIEVALESLKAKESLAVLAEKHTIHPTQITLWKKQLKEKLRDFFSTGKPQAARDEKLTEQLYQKIGRLEMDLEWLKKVREIPTEERIRWVTEDDSKYSQNRLLTLCSLGKSTFYYQPTPESDQNLLLMRFLYKVAFIDWNSRFIHSYAISNTLDSVFVITAFQEAIKTHGVPQIVNTDQGSQFTSKVFTGILKDHGIKISMDGRGRALDNVRIERYWLSYKYECVYLNSITDGWHLKRLTDEYIKFYNHTRTHQHLKYKTPHYEYKNGLLLP